MTPLPHSVGECCGSSYHHRSDQDYGDLSQNCLFKGELAESVEGGADEVPELVEGAFGAWGACGVCGLAPAPGMTAGAD